MTKKTTKAKAEPKLGSVKKEKAVLFYVNPDKVRRAEHLVANGKFKKLIDAYKSLDGVLAEGHGYMPV
jgi:hypothetical protein